MDETMKARVMKISNAEVLVDYKNTVKEIKAYVRLAEGYQWLSELPENISSGVSKVYANKASYYNDLIRRCWRLEGQLKKLLIERGMGVPE